jgi:DNA-binding LytR/AlgR family response regulator
MPQLDVVIVDDEPVAIRRLASLLRRCDGVSVTGTASNAEEAHSLVKRCLPDLVLLDIEMPGINGIGLADQLRALPDAPAVIFVTAFSRFALEAFDVAATDYLLKPVEAPRLIEAIERVRAQRTGRQSAQRIAELEDLVSRLRSFEQASVAADNEVMWFPSAQGHDRVAVRDIEWIEAERDYVHIHTRDKSYFVRGRLGDLEKRLAGHGVIRVHRSAMVRAAAITRVEAYGDRGYRLVMANGAAVRASRRFGSRVRELTGRHR